ncbi:hypothetical protein [Reichenbachiella sp. MSK19-1]|uniref:hypothetical protein n=1 Tax=Reichenbachiella sp. MSK19-1 TaxID=1897631 RepID=UPI000E6B8EE3|nr:hypothetical protein [Reichenbachiella sp. MSK19-1]RJE71860.1 hypothetical protein BGP76_07170 [Reichenbachiella sp. MSK19-1]
MRNLIVFGVVLFCLISCNQIQPEGGFMSLEEELGYYRALDLPILSVEELEELKEQKAQLKEKLREEFLMGPRGKRLSKKREGEVKGEVKKLDKVFKYVEDRIPLDLSFSRSFYYTLGTMREMVTLYDSLNENCDANIAGVGLFLNKRAGSMGGMISYIDCTMFPVNEKNKVLEDFCEGLPGKLNKEKDGTAFNNSAICPDDC